MKLALGTVVLFLVFVAQPYLAPVRAESRTPRHDYPRSVFGTCAKFHDYGGVLATSHVQEAITMCDKQGVSLERHEVE